MFSRIRLLCFDLDNTFWPVEPVIAAAEQAVIDWLAEHHPPLVVGQDAASLRAARIALARQHPERAHDLTWLRTESLARLAQSAGRSADIGHQAFEVFIEARHRVEFYPDVMPALDLLGRKFRLATLSNGNADLERIGCAARFEFSLSAGGIGAAKPDARVFRTVLDRIGCAPDEVLYVGDDPDHDVLGPKQIGLRAAWLKRDPQRVWPLADIEPDLVLGSLGDLVSALSRTR
jgi:FMN hydrolase / 5-amino-6-(5-phospho-D-ribitylamino)uracil phosphatase